METKVSSRKLTRVGIISGMVPFVFALIFFKATEFNIGVLTGLIFALVMSETSEIYKRNI